MALLHTKQLHNGSSFCHDSMLRNSLPWCPVDIVHFIDGIYFRVASVYLEHSFVFEMMATSRMVLTAVKFTE